MSHTPITVPIPRGCCTGWFFEHSADCTSTAPRPCSTCGADPGEEHTYACSWWEPDPDQEAQEPDQATARLLVFAPPPAPHQSMTRSVADALRFLFATDQIDFWHLHPGQPAQPPAAVLHDTYLLPAGDPFTGYVHGGALHRLPAAVPESRQLTPALVQLVREIAGAHDARPVMAYTVTVYLPLPDPGRAGACLCEHDANEHDGGGLCTAAGPGGDGCACLTWRNPAGEDVR